ncbi:ribonuclease P protein subunit p30-like [Histomonas meleagridis]|uniref:ribonuclease P protein subunit p30-like n=1 Tax=Histomonas meleagridis TaxID=135588 RepID=UPI0035597F64|nr:ribonuclease P protein subunit p30-like [Histomonas meleagridis]KAH0800693.1 ribonuclease P protein subunit p30-like [Histomonas meleagridis]
MEFEVNLPYETVENIPSDQLRMSINRVVRCGWNGVVLTVNVTTMNKYPPPPDPLTLSDASSASIRRSYGLCVLSDYPKFPQFTRLNLITDNIQEIHQLSRHLNTIRYDLISVTPLTDSVFKAACSSADIDILSIDVSKYQPISCWKELKSLVNRGVAIELQYSMFLQTDSKMKSLISAAASICHATKGRHGKDRIILLGCGSNDPDFIRSPSDIRNLARLLGLPKVETLTNTAVRDVVAKGMARKANAGTVRRMKERILEQSDDSDDFIDFVVKKTA